MTGLLERYTARAKKMTEGELIFALYDVNRTLPLYLDNDPTQGYAAKLWAEKDAYSVELSLRKNKQKKRK